MLTTICPKLPMRNKAITKDYYINQLKFKVLGNTDYEGYLMIVKDEIEIHFFEFPTITIAENYGQIYIRVTNIESLYQSYLLNNVAIHPNGKLEKKPWQQKEFSLLDPDNNLLTFGESVD